VKNRGSRSGQATFRRFGRTLPVLAEVRGRRRRPRRLWTSGPRASRRAPRTDTLLQGVELGRTV